MPSNDERRQVAARLRKIEVDAYCCCEDYLEAIEYAIGCIVGQDYKEPTYRLADLIEPDPERTCKPIDPFDKETKHIVERGLSHYYWPYKGCPECQCDFPQGSNFCPNCGRRVTE